MEKKEVVFDIKEGGEHGVRYKICEVGAVVVSICVMCKALGTPVPNKIKVTIEEEK